MIISRPRIIDLFPTTDRNYCLGKRKVELSLRLSPSILTAFDENPSAASSFDSVKAFLIAKGDTAIIPQESKRSRKKGTKK